MSEARQFTIGTEVACSDGICGDLSRVVVDPVARTVTHLVVEPKHRRGLGRLVPIDLVDPTTGEIRLRGTVAEFERLEGAEETRFLPGTGSEWGYGTGHVLFWPYYGLLTGSESLAGNAPQPVIYDNVPLGEVEVRRGEQVHASDGSIGRVQGLVVDPRDHHVTHVLLEEGHLWGRKEVAIPISAVTGVDDGIQLNITKEEVQALPPVSLDQ
jgi:sporulation protein YlmC with PRC-barrel domain